jgi:hypothetical protein
MLLRCGAFRALVRSLTVAIADFPVIYSGHSHLQDKSRRDIICHIGAYTEALEQHHRQCLEIIQDMKPLVDAAKQTTEMTSQRMISKISDSILPQSPDRNRKADTAPVSYASPVQNSVPEYSRPAAPPAAPYEAPAPAPSPVPAPAPAPTEELAADEGSSGFAFIEEPAEVEKPAL